MIKQFSINPDVRITLQRYLERKSLTLKEAMDKESSNHDVAEIIHAGLPTMIKKLYSLEKMKSLFWRKRDTIYDFIVGRVQVDEVKKVVKKERKHSVK